MLNWIFMSTVVLLGYFLTFSQISGSVKWVSDNFNSFLIFYFGFFMMFGLFTLYLFQNETLLWWLDFRFNFIIRFLYSAYQSNTFYSVNIWWTLANQRFAFILLRLLWWFWLIDLLRFWRWYDWFIVINWLISWTDLRDWFNWLWCSCRLSDWRLGSFDWFGFLFDLSSDRFHSAIKKKIIHVFLEVGSSSICIQGLFLILLSRLITVIDSESSSSKLCHSKSVSL